MGKHAYIPIVATPRAQRATQRKKAPSRRGLSGRWTIMESPKRAGRPLVTS